MTNPQSKQVHERAFGLWEAAGRPHGHDLDHWLQAEHEVSDKAKPARTAKPRKAAAKSPLEGTAKSAVKTTRASKAAVKTTRAKKS